MEWICGMCCWEYRLQQQQQQRSHALVASPVVCASVSVSVRVYWVPVSIASFPFFHANIYVYHATCMKPPHLVPLSSVTSADRVLCYLKVSMGLDVPYLNSKKIKKCMFERHVIVIEKWVEI